MIRLSRITIYPIKALDGIDVPEVSLSSGGALQGDREFALFDAKERFVNGKQNEQVHRLRSRYDLTARTVTLSVEDTAASDTFHLDRDRRALSGWLTNYFGVSITLKQNCETGFPDDTDANGPTVISLGTYQEVATWFPALSVEQLRHRFRANLELAGVPAFWEDRLFSQPGQGIRFRIGEVQFMGINPCQRCIVPTRNPWTGQREPIDFQKKFIARRRETLPEWVNPAHFNHFYRLSVNTRILATDREQSLQVGDEVTIVDKGIPSQSP